MPTGYTANVADGKITDLRSFAMQCARGMGALIMMRDESWSAPIPERFEPSDYYAKKVQEGKAERDALYAMSNDDADRAAKAEYQEKLAAKEAYLDGKKEMRSRYEAMIALVEAWQFAPEGLKEFMLEQLHTGMNFDCGGDGSYWEEVELLSGAEWKAKKLERVQQSIIRDAAEHAKEIERTESRNAWIAQLRASLDHLA